MSAPTLPKDFMPEKITTKVPTTVEATAVAAPTTVTAPVATITAVAPTSTPDAPKLVRTVYGHMHDLSTGIDYQTLPSAYEELTPWMSSQIAAGKMAIVT